MLKIDLLKEYDRVSWVYLHLLLTHLGYEVAFIDWVMSYITSMSLAILINEATSTLFHAQHGIQHGWPLSPLLFTLVVEGLSRLLADAKIRYDLRDTWVVEGLTIMHLLFVNEILLFYDGSRNDIVAIKYALILFQKATCMQINSLKSIITFLGLSMDESVNVQNLFPFHSNKFNDGLKCLRFHLKSNDYKKVD